MTQPTPLPPHTSDRPEPHQPADGEPGVFVPRRVIVATACFALGMVFAVLVWLAPGLWPPLDAAIAVTGLTLALYALWRGRDR